MIEVMVTIVVVAFGLLGLAALMLKGLQAGTTSQVRSMAVSQAYDMADRIRANASGTSAGNYSAIVPSGSATSCSSGSISTTHVGTPGSSPGTCPPCTSTCSASDVAARDKCEWQKANSRLLPNGAGAVCKDSSKNWYTIYVSWDEGRTGATDKTFSLSFEP